MGFKVSLMLISIGILLLLILTSCSKVPTEQELYACSQDSDCVIVSKDCCGCPKTTINKNYRDYWNNRLGCQGIETFSCPLIGCIDTNTVCVKEKCQSGFEILNPNSLHKLSIGLHQIMLEQKSDITIPIGIKNINQRVLKFKMSIVPTERLNSDLILGEEIDDNFLYDLSIQELQPNQSISIPLQITSETVTGIGLFRLTVLDVTDSEEGLIYDSNTFLITVS